ncbi:hypothetical protein AOPFMNJM_1660 [Methylobacterium jeotgali]|uniref:Uncharacterized protein n=3 Tax=Pseudomonadota TaxID=1224 RepID=A0ABQ4SSZ5_9HYPH|nr:hypothetical protein [Methylobacterium jeotgali]GJE06344.1 hypothetical protein AOPFMNJM_1660 [Methylobacterium jeotgali]
MSVTAEQAISAIVTLIGSGGLVAIVTAFLAYKQEAAKGRRGDPDGRVVAMQVAGAPCLTQSKEFELLANTMSALSIEVAENNRLLRAQAERVEFEHELEDRATMELMRRFVREHGAPMVDRPGGPLNRRRGDVE